ncbi:hypothetical protein KIN20_021739 [Parelaphostrongylus tenuis]|uniref:Uncharacterized protein n=1 Tax=Parelaphostrongylus tenuis TaxID=148309 RepID=A0AAD5N4Z0_PARTN|nr:hypothetical protein KIN20_021739 [Parelaphostrongylus tenuis]
MNPLECKGAHVNKDLSKDIEGVMSMIPHCIIVGNTTTNVIMANWSKEMWQGVLNRAVRMLAAGPFALHFSSASGTINSAQVSFGMCLMNDKFMCLSFLSFTEVFK